MLKSEEVVIEKVPKAIAGHSSHGNTEISFAFMHCVVCKSEKQLSTKNALFPITTSSLLKHANHAMHGSETWYACVFECFHDNH